MRNVRRGNTPSTLARYAEAVMTASHSYPSENRLHGRKSGSHPRLDLLEAQDCCCCLPLQIGLMIIGAFDLTRLVNSIAYAADGIDMYTQPEWMAPADAIHLLRASLVVACPKVLFWLLLPFSMCTEGTTVLSLLLVWLPIDLLYSIIFAALNAGLAERLCEEDLRMYPSTGRIGFRRSIDGPGPYQVDEHGVPIICLNFHWQEIWIGVGDVVLCALVALSTAYYGWSLLRYYGRGGDHRVRTAPQRSTAPHRV